MRGDFVRFYRGSNKGLEMIDGGHSHFMERALNLCVLSAEGNHLSLKGVQFNLREGGFSLDWQYSDHSLRHNNYFGTVVGARTLCLQNVFV